MDTEIHASSLMYSVVAYAAYIQEEIWDTAQLTIATGCTPRAGGGRPGLRGGTRCTFGEFCEHIWKETTGDTKPTGVDWGKNDKLIDDAKMNPEDLVRKIMSQLKMDDPKGGSKKVKIPKPGFTGKADAKLIFPNIASTGDGLADYYKAMEHCGDRMVECKAQFDKIQGSLPQEFKDKFNKWVNNGRDGAELLYDLRKQDKWSAMYGDKGKLDAKMGVDTAKTPGTSRFKYVNSKPAWNIMDVAGTINKFTGADLAEKTTAFEAKWKLIEASAAFQGHESALKSVEKIKIQTASCK
jgi:hypothetical protein